MKNKPFLILQLRPEDEVSDNEFEAFLKYGELDRNEVERIRVERAGVPEIDLDKYSAVIVGGSPFDVSTPEIDKSDIQKKIESDFNELFPKIIEKDFPFFGACSGSGLLGRYLGANISGKYTEPVGGMDIFLTEAGKKDSLLSGLPSEFRVLLGHKEACDDTPPKAVLLASSKTCPVQMFRVKENIYSTQFHPELDAWGCKVRTDAYRDHGYFAPERAEEIMAAVKNEDTSVARKILKRFVKKYRV